MALAVSSSVLTLWAAATGAELTTVTVTFASAESETLPSLAAYLKISDPA